MKEYPVLGDWMFNEKRPVHKVYSIVIECSNQKGSREDGQNRLKNILTEACPTTTLTDNDVSYMISHLQTLLTFFKLPRSERVKKLVDKNGIPASSKYSLLWLLKRLNNGKSYEPKPGTILYKITQVACCLDVPQEPASKSEKESVDPELMKKGDQTDSANPGSHFPVNPLFFSAQQEMLKEGTKTMNDLIPLLSAWKERALSAEKKIEELTAQCNELRITVTLQEEQLGVTNDFLTAMKKAKQVLEE
ncbi:MAG: hypothetical protein AAB870_01130 [Patescibacteria group bacterium]